MVHSICSVTVNWNAASVLPEQLRLLMEQTTPIQEIIVVDNASSDGTAEMLMRDYPHVTLLRLPTNEGVGGGYAAGLDYAVNKQNYEWVWTLDQDSRPAANCVTELMAAYSEFIARSRQKVGVLAAMPLNIATGTTYPGWAWSNGMVNLPDDPSAPIQMADLVISSGSLISGEVVKKVGLPRKDFFMDFVDFEYCLRLRRRGFLIVTVRAAALAHSIGVPQKKSILGLSWVWATHTPWREYYKIRNQTYTIWHQQPTWRAKVYLLRKFVRHACGVLLFDSGKFQRLSFMFAGLRDGIRGRLGVVVTPGLNS